jgi:hypothetical protein
MTIASNLHSLFSLRIGTHILSATQGRFASSLNGYFSVQTWSKGLAFRLWAMELPVHYRGIPRGGTNPAFRAGRPVGIRFIPHWFAHVVNLDRKLRTFFQPVLDLGSRVPDKSPEPAFSTVATITLGGCRAGKCWGDGVTERVVWHIVKQYAAKLGFAGFAPHDLRRSCAKLCHSGGGELDQIQFLLGHVSVQTTERYLGCKQRIRGAVNDHICIEP